MVSKHAELKWEESMIDNGVARYHAKVEAARYRKGKSPGAPALALDESSTSYGLALLREYFEEYEATISTFVDTAYKNRGKRDIAAAYIARCDPETVAYIAAKTIIDAISDDQNQTALAFRVAGKLEDQMQFIRFDVDHHHYLERLIEDMNKRGIENYSWKRKTLTHCHTLANGREGIDEWTSWSRRDKLRIGQTLISLFQMATGLIKDVMVLRDKKTVATIRPTARAVELIQANKDLFETLTPEFLPMLTPPVDWTDAWTGGYQSAHLQNRRPLVKIKGFCRKKHRAAIDAAVMPEVFDAVNAAQATPWRVNAFVLEQAVEEIKNLGIGCPGDLKTPPPTKPEDPLDDLDLSAKAKKAIRAEQWALMTDAEKEEVSTYRNNMRDWSNKQHSQRNKVLSLHHTLNVARLLSTKDEFYFVHFLDSRGRAYPCGSYLTPQGNKLAKGLLEYVDFTKLGPWGYWHLAIHAAGVYGVDDVLLEERVEWINTNKTLIMQTWQDPTSTRDFWGSADKPYMFLAACKELTEIWMFHGTKMLTVVNKAELENAAPVYESRIPCAQDGSCNGIQHFSAMLLDTDGATAVNMTGGRTVQDIYKRTAETAAGMLRTDLENEEVLDGKTKKTATKEDLVFMRMWLDVLLVDRSLCKKSTMTVPYGGKKRSCKDDIYQCTIDKVDALNASGAGINWDSQEITSAAWIMHHYVWKALDIVVVAARRAMKFLAKIASVNNHAGKALEWTSPTGFQCFQDYREVKHKTVDTYIGGRTQCRYTEETDNLSSHKMVNGFPPNFLHSMDASHMVKAVCAALNIGITSFALVHDSFSVPAGHCEAFHKIIRRTFIDMYQTDQLLRILIQQKEKNPDLADKYPSISMVEQGDFDLESVSEALFFFR